MKKKLSIKQKENAKLLKQLAKFYQVEIEFMPHEGGFFFKKKLKIIVGLVESQSECLSVFFHELMHLKCFLEKKHSAYHQHGSTEAIKKYGYNKYIDLAFKAENYVDKQAEKLFNEWKTDKRVKYIRAYRNKDLGKAFLHGFYLMER